MSTNESRVDHRDHELVEPLRDCALAACIGLVSRDEVLTQRIAVVTSRCGCALTIAQEASAVHSMLSGCAHAMVVVDTSAADIVPVWMRECARWGSVQDDAVLLMTGGLAAARHESAARRVAVYPRRELANLLEELTLKLPPCAMDPDPTRRIVGDSPEVRLIRQEIRNVARFPDVSVLVLGETGTGKELVAEAIHALSCPPGRPFVAINCAAIPEHLFESELFGHEAGAYTGARGLKLGLLESAAGGTVFLDEIAEMPESLQPKLLRALESRRFRRVGSNRDVPLQARVVSATQRIALDRGKGSLRPDLYYRLAGFTLALPPLRDRPNDIDVLARTFLAAFRARHPGCPLTFTERALETLHAHFWPGNVRELKMVVEHAVILANDDVVTAADVSVALRHQPARRPPSSIPPAARPELRRVDSVPGRGLRELERELILKAFEQNGRNVSRAARALGLPRTTLRARLKRYGVG